MRDKGHGALLRPGRLIAGINTFDEVPENLLQPLLLIPTKKAKHCTFEDAALLARYDCPFEPGTTGYNTFIKERMQP